MSQALDAFFLYLGKGGSCARQRSLRWRDHEDSLAGEHILVILVAARCFEGNNALVIPPSRDLDLGPPAVEAMLYGNANRLIEEIESECLR